MSPTISAALAVKMFCQYAGAPVDADGYRFVQQIPWVESLGISYHVGVDGLNVGLILMGAIVAFAAACCSWEIKEREKEFYILLLVMSGGILGAFASLDLFIMPSRSEAWGLAALEAMAHGVPVIASDIGGLPEIVEPGNGGWLVPVGDATALARAITMAATNLDLLWTQSQKARERARLFSVDRMVEQTEAFYSRFKK